MRPARCLSRRDVPCVLPAREFSYLEFAFSAGFQFSHKHRSSNTQNNTLVRVAVACPQLHAVAMHGVVALRPLSPPTRRATTLPPRLDSMGRVSRLCHSHVHTAHAHHRDAREAPELSSPPTRLPDACGRLRELTSPAGVLPDTCSCQSTQPGGCCEGPTPGALTSERLQSGQLALTNHWNETEVVTFIFR